MNETQILDRGVANIIPGKDELLKALKGKKKLNIYFGIDPTTTKIHLGHAVPLRKLNQLANLGHNVTFLIGDFTALIGDTSDKESERPALTTDEIKENFKTYQKQAEKIVDFRKIKVRRNSEWLSKLSFEEIVKLSQYFSVGDFISRELIKKRLGEGKRVGLNELLYPIMQGYDSYFLDTDLQIGGTDQTFNMQSGRTLQKVLRNKESFVLTTPILEGVDSRKMSKSLGNAIWLDDTSNDIYAKVMAIEDQLILTYFELLTDVESEKISEYADQIKRGDNPRNIKDILAREIVRELEGDKQAKEVSLGVSEIEVRYKENTPVFDIAIKDAGVKSKSEWKRLIEQKGVTIDTDVVTDPNAIIGEGSLIKIGPRKVLRNLSSK